jgi:catechol 2,3-dioxygenase-like lactoylglutathione lyase family enzyme
MERHMARIRHIAIFSDDPANLADFYADVFGMKVNGKSNQGAVWMTDGYMDIALLPRRNNELAPQGLHHFGITVDVDEKDHIYARLKERGHKLMTPPPGRPYVEDAVKDADGNKFDISTSQVKGDGKNVALKDEQRVKELEKA